MIKMIVGEVVVTVLSVYAAQSGLTIAEKELFYNNLKDLVQTTDDWRCFKSVVIQQPYWKSCFRL